MSGICHCVRERKGIDLESNLMFLDKMLSLSNFVGDTSHFWWGGTHCRIQIFLNLHMSTQMAFGERQRPSFKAYCQCHFSTRCSPIPPKINPSLSVHL